MHTSLRLFDASYFFSKSLRFLGEWELSRCIQPDELLLESRSWSKYSVVKGPHHMSRRRLLFNLPRWSHPADYVLEVGIGVERIEPGIEPKINEPSRLFCKCFF